jgi:hypothetical protein
MGWSASPIIAARPRLAHGEERHADEPYKRRLCLDPQFHFAARGGPPYHPRQILNSAMEKNNA